MRFLRLLLAVVIACWTLIVLPSPAQAWPWSDLCTSAPGSQMPGDNGTFTGWLDPGPAVPNPHSTSVYDTVGYPPEWSTYDLGCGPSAVTNPQAVFDTTVGNWEKGAASSIVALCNSLHRLVTSPAVIEKLHPILDQGVQAVHNALFNPYIALALIAVAASIMIAARKQDAPKAINAAVWAVLVLGIATALWHYPTRMLDSYNRASTSAVENINSEFGQHTAPGDDPSTGRANLLVNTVLYRQWCIGELGAVDVHLPDHTLPNGETSVCRALLDAQTFTYADAAQIKKDPARFEKIVQESGPASIVRGTVRKVIGVVMGTTSGSPPKVGKAKAFTMIADALKKYDKNAWTHLQGKAGGRIGQGAASLLAALLTAPFMIVSDVVLLLSKLLLLLLLIGFPGIAVFGVLVALRALILGVFAIALAALINACVFAAASAVNALVVTSLLSTQTGLPGWFTLLLCGLTAAVLARLLRPFRRIGALVSPGSVLGRAGGDPSLPDTGRHRRALRRQYRRHRPHFGRHHDDDRDGGPAVEKPAPGPVPETWSRPPTRPHPVHDRPVFQPSGPRPDPALAGDDAIVWRIWDPDTATYTETRVKR